MVSLEDLRVSTVSFTGGEIRFTMEALVSLRISWEEEGVEGDAASVT